MSKNINSNKKKKFVFIVKHKALTSIIAVLLVAAVIFAGLFVGGVFSKKDTAYSYIRTTVLKKGSLENSISATGTVESAETSNVTSNLNYTVKSISVAVGDIVKKGDIICQLDTEDIEKQIKTEENNVSKQYSSAEKNYNTAKESYNSKKDELSNAEKTLNSAKSDMNSAEKPYNTAKKAIASIQNNYDKALDGYNKAGAEFVKKQSEYNKAVSSSKDIVKKAKAYMTAVQNLYGGCTVGIYDISDSTLVSGSNQQTGVNNSNSSSQSVSVNQTANDICSNVVSTVKKLTGQSITYTSGSNTLYKLAQKATALKNAKATSNYNTLESAYTTAKSTFESANQSYSQIKESLKQTENQLDSAKEQLDNSSSSETLDNLYEQLEECSIKANQDGTIVSLNATVGSYVGGSSSPTATSGQSSALATISRTDKLKVSITISEADVNNAKIGLPCYITSDADDEALSGTLTQIDPIANETGSFGAEVSVDDKSTSLLIGMNASVSIIVSSTEDIFSVPTDAIGTDDTGEFVYRKTLGEGVDMEFEKIYVTTGEENDYYTEISSEKLSEGDIIRSSADLSEGVETSQTDTDNSDNQLPMFNMRNNDSDDRKMPEMDGNFGNENGGNMTPPNNGGMK